MLAWRQRGDTLIEVLFAFSILSLIVVGAMSIMNQGTVASQRALETSLVREQIDAQAETIRFLHGAYISAYQPGTTYPANTPAGQWSVMTQAITTEAATDFGGLLACPALKTSSFIVDSINATYIPASSGKIRTDPNVFVNKTYAQVGYDATSGILSYSDGIWVEGVRSQTSSDVNQQNVRYIDFHIYACWDSPGQGPPITIGTIVRLYEPRG